MSSSGCRLSLLPVLFLFALPLTASGIWATYHYPIQGKSSQLAVTVLPFSGGKTVIRLSSGLSYTGPVAEYRAVVRGRIPRGRWFRPRWKRVFGKLQGGIWVPSALLFRGRSVFCRTGRRAVRLDEPKRDPMIGIFNFSNPFYFFTADGEAPSIVFRRKGAVWIVHALTKQGFRPVKVVRYERAVNRNHFNDRVTGVPKERITLVVVIRMPSGDIRKLELIAGFSPVDHGSGRFGRSADGEGKLLYAYTGYSTYSAGPCEQAWNISYESQGKFLITRRGDQYTLYIMNKVNGKKGVRADGKVTVTYTEREKRTTRQYVGTLILQFGNGRKKAYRHVVRYK